MSRYSLTILTWCQCGRWLRRHFWKNFKGFSQILKEQSRNFRTLRSNIFAKTKKFVKPFLSVRVGPRSNLLSQNLVTLPLLPAYNICYSYRQSMSMTLAPKGSQWAWLLLLQAANEHDSYSYSQPMSMNLAPTGSQWAWLLLLKAVNEHDSYF